MPLCSGPGANIAGRLLPADREPLCAGPGANNAGRLLPSVQNWTIYRKDRSGAVTDRPGVELVFFCCAIRDRPVCTNTPCAGILAWPGVGVMLRCLRSNHFSTGSHNQKNTPKNMGEFRSRLHHGFPCANPTSTPTPPSSESYCRCVFSSTVCQDLPQETGIITASCQEAPERTSLIALL